MGQWLEEKVGQKKGIFWGENKCLRLMGRAQETGRVEVTGEKEKSTAQGPWEGRKGRNP